MVRKSFGKEIKIFEENNGLLRTGQAIKLGIHQQILARMCEAGVLVREARGWYRLADLPPLSNPDLVQVAARIPESVVCLISALSFLKISVRGIPTGQTRSHSPQSIHRPARCIALKIPHDRLPSVCWLVSIH